MAMEIASNYNNVYENNYAAQKQENAKKNERSEAATQKSSNTESSKTKGAEGYMKGLEKLAPSVEFRIGNGCASDKSGKTLTINPKLLEKMQNEPEMEKKMKELIKGVEAMTRLADSMDKAAGYTTVYRHSYIDENGKYCHAAYIVKKDLLNEKLRKEAQENAEKLIEKTKEKAIKKKKELQKVLEEKKAEAEGLAEKQEKNALKAKETEQEENTSGVAVEKTNTAQENAEEILLKKLEDSENGKVYFDDDDMRLFLAAAKEDAQEKGKIKNPVVAGNHFNMQI